MRGSATGATTSDTATSTTTTSFQGGKSVEETTMYGHQSTVEAARHRQQGLLHQAEQSRRSAVLIRAGRQRHRAVAPAVVRRPAPNSA